MLNRLYIVVGILAILAIGAAFIVPRLIPWGNYRDRMEALATEALGTHVAINGDIRFSLLPQPHLSLMDVAVGPGQTPVMAVKSVDADFSLMDFLRDRYSMTRLVLDHPVLELRVDDHGHLATGLALPAAVTRANVSVANASVAGGLVRIIDARSAQTVEISGVDGELALGAIRGPFAFQGAASLGDDRYSLHLASTALAADGTTQVSFFAKPDKGAFSVNASGILTTGQAPHLVGDLSYRQTPAAAKDASSAQGDLTFTSKLDATADKIALSSYALQPDENRAATRLTGSAVINLGKSPNFDASISGGVLASASTSNSPTPYSGCASNIPR